MKRKLSYLNILLVLTMVAGMIAAPQAQAETNADRPNVNIRFAQFGNSTDDPDGMSADPIKKAIEEAVNVTLEYDSGTAGFDERMATELATGGAPDLLPTWGQTEIITDWIKQDVVLKLSDIIAANPGRYPTLDKIFSDPAYKAYNKLYSGDEDAVYAIYAVAAFAAPAFPGVPVYNTAFLKEYNGGNVPKTVEEFIAFTKAAGAAGKAGWWPRNDKLTNWSEIDATIAKPQGTTIAAPKGNAWDGFIATGTLGTDEVWTIGATTDKSREVVKQMADMYAANGLHQGIGVRGDFDDAYAEFGTGGIGAVNFGFGYPAQFRDFYNTAWVSAKKDMAQVSDLTLGTALTGENGYGHHYDLGMWMGAHYFIPYTCKNPERVLDLVEFLASGRGQTLLFKGIEGLHYTGQADPAAYDVPAWAKVNGAYGYPDPDRARYVWFGYMFSATEYRVDFENKGWWEAVTTPYDNSNDWLSDEDRSILGYAKEIIAGFVDEVAVKMPSYYTMIALPAEAGAIRTKLQDISNRYLTQMIGGQMDIDTGWASYVKEYEDAGAASLEKMLNDAVSTARSGF